MLSRRNFLLGLGRAGGVSAVYGAMSALGLLPVPPAYAGPPTLAPGRGTRVVVLGAGIAGLVAALELRRAGYDVTVLEARTRPGGRVFTVRRGSVIEEVDSRQRVGWDAEPDLFFDAGAARLPQHHQGILGYARELHVPIEVLSNENRGALLRAEGAFGGQPQRNRRVNADARGFVAELAAKALDGPAALARPLSVDDKEKIRAFLRNFGALDDQLVYRGSERGGWAELPGAGARVGRVPGPLDVRQLLDVGFWGGLYDITEDTLQAATMLRPVGGMSRIAEAMAARLGRAVHYGAEVTRLRRRGEGAQVEWRNTGSGARHALHAPFILCTIQPQLLSALDHDFAAPVRQALTASWTSALCKVAFQAERRFWELDDHIYGGISWTDHPITQIWYPSQGIGHKKGILVGAYTFRSGEAFTALSVAERLELALQGGEQLHPGYRRWVGQGVTVAWRRMKWSSGATSGWSEEGRTRDYPVLLEADGPYHFAGEYLSHVTGWQEGAVLSAHQAVGKIGDKVQARRA